MAYSFSTTITVLRLASLQPLTLAKVHFEARSEKQVYHGLLSRQSGKFKLYLYHLTLNDHSYQPPTASKRLCTRTGLIALRSRSPTPLACSAECFGGVSREGLTAFAVN